MCRTLVHRGPDSEGYYFDENMVLGMTRLKIIDPETGDQPVFNGEIYNYEQLQNNLMNIGISLKTKSDTETIGYLYEKNGDKFVKELRGMFAISIWDKRKKRLVLARNRMGIKPLYYYFTSK